MNDYFNQESYNELSNDNDSCSVFSNDDVEGNINDNKGEENETYSSEESLKRNSILEDKPNVLLNIICIILPFCAWIPFYIYKKDRLKMAKSCIMCGFISSVVVSIFTMNGIAVICAIIYATIYWAN